MNIDVLYAICTLQIKKGNFKFSSWATACAYDLKHLGLDQSENINRLKSIYAMMAGDPKLFGIIDEDANQMDCFRIIREFDLNKLLPVKQLTPIFKDYPFWIPMGDHLTDTERAILTFRAETNNQSLSYLALRLPSLISRYSPVERQQAMQILRAESRTPDDLAAAMMTMGSRLVALAYEQKTWMKSLTLPPKLNQELEDLNLLELIEINQIQ